MKNIYYCTIRDKTPGGINEFRYLCKKYGITIKYIDSYCVWIHTYKIKYYLLKSYIDKCEIN